MFLQEFEWLGRQIREDLLLSATKWGSIEAPFLRFDRDKGIPEEKRSKCYGLPNFGKFYGDAEFTVTEKVDGTNIAVIFVYGKDVKTPDACFIRSRNELLCYTDDLLGKNHFDAITTIRPYLPNLSVMARRLCEPSGCMIVFYGELYGRGIQRMGGYYRADKDYRLFAVKMLAPAFFEFLDDQPRPEHNRYRFMHMLPAKWLFSEAERVDVPTVPHLDTIHGRDVDSPEKVLALLDKYPSSVVATNDCNNRNVRPEGLVIQSDHPYMIYKLKENDY